MIRFYRYFEDIAQAKFKLFKRLEDLIIALPDDARGHRGYAYKVVGSVPYHIPETYILVELLQDANFTRRRGFFQFEGPKPFYMPIPLFKPTDAHLYKVMGHHIDDALMLAGVIARMASKVPSGAPAEVMALLDMANVQGQKLSEVLEALLAAVNLLSQKESGEPKDAAPSADAPS